MIAVFDSGVGGLSVLRHIPRLLPKADILYLADQARAPYGIRSLEQVEEIAVRVSSSLIEAGAETVVVACNTASAAALDTLRREFPATPFVGMEPAVKPAVGSTTSGVIGILATGATFQSERFASVVRRFAGGADIHVAACPEWVTMVESGHLTGPDVEAAVRGRLEPILSAGADTLVLGCTHFPFLVDTITAVAGPSVRVVDPGDAVARQVSRVHSVPGSGSITSATTGDVDVLSRQTQLLVPELGLPRALAFES